MIYWCLFDSERFREALQSCSSLGQIRGGGRLDTAAVASLARGVLFAGAYPVNAMLAGYDGQGAGPSMYCVGAGSVGVHRVEHGAVGCGSELCAAVMDRYYRAGMTVQEAVGLVDRCIREVRRLGVAGAPASFVIKMVDKDGTREYARRTYVKEIKALNNVVSSGCTRASPMLRNCAIE